MLREDRPHPAEERGGKGFLIADDDGARIGCLHGGDKLEVGAARGGNLLIHDRLAGEGDIGRGEGGSVMPAHTVSQGESDDRLGLEGTFLAAGFQGGEGERVKALIIQDPIQIIRFLKTGLFKNQRQQLPLQDSLKGHEPATFQCHVCPFCLFLRGELKRRLLRKLPLDGQITHDLKILIVFDQSVEDQSANL